MNQLVYLALVVQTLLVVPRISHAQYQLRTWTSMDGKHTTEAELDSVLERGVKLQSAAGKTIIVPFETLSREDLIFLLKTEEARRAAPKPASERPRSDNQNAAGDEIATSENIKAAIEWYRKELGRISGSQLTSLQTEAQQNQMFKDFRGQSFVVGNSYTMRVDDVSRSGLSLVIIGNPSRVIDTTHESIVPTDRYDLKKVNKGDAIKVSERLYIGQQGTFRKGPPQPSLQARLLAAKPIKVGSYPYAEQLVPRQLVTHESSKQDAEAFAVVYSDDLAAIVVYRRFEWPWRANR